MTERFHGPASIGSTVSIATLRIPDEAWKHFLKAKAAAQRHRLAESDRETGKALAIAPDFAAAYLLRAAAEVQAHSFEAAIENVREARRVEPDVMWAAVVLAGAYNGLREYEQARAVLKEMRGIEAESWQASYESARAAIGLNDVETALRASALAQKAAPANFIDTYLVRTNALILAHRWSEAEEQMESYLQSKKPEERRADLLTALENVKQRAREQELEKMASR